MKSTNEPIRIMVVDDHPVVRGGLAALVRTQADMLVIAEAEDGQRAVEMFREHRPDIVMMDLVMPAMSGIEATIQIRQGFPDARIIVLTTFDGDEDIYQALQAGAKSYLLKETHYTEVLEAIRAVYAGHRRIPPEIQARLAKRPPCSELNPRELEILRLIVSGMGNKEIGEALAITERGVKFHVTNILGKLCVSDRTQAVVVAVQRGIIHLG